MSETPQKFDFRRLLQPYVLKTYIILGALQLMSFYPTRLALPYLPVHMLGSPLDELIPFRPAWVIVYFLSFPFWIFSKLWIISESREQAHRFSAYYTLALIFTAAAFLLYPCTIQRPEITGTGLFDDLMRLVYFVDDPKNLLPSLHVLATYFCWRGMRGCRTIPKWYKVFSFIFIFAVCLSVLFVKQHAAVDIPTGILFAEVPIQIGKMLRLERIPAAIEKHFHKEN